MQKFGILLLLFLLQASCGLQDLLESSTAVRVSTKPISEFEENQAVAMGIVGLNISDTEVLKQILDAGAPAIYIYDNSYLGADWNAAQITSLNKTREILKNEGSKRAVFGKHANKIFHIVSEFREYGRDYTWARDWGPFPLRTSSGSIQFANFRYAMDETPALATLPDVTDFFGQHFKVQVEKISEFFEGGNFATDGQGNCFIGAGGRVKATATVNLPNLLPALKNQLGCKEVTVLPGANEIGFFHIDLWMKFVSEDTVLVGKVSKHTLNYLDKLNESNSQEAYTKKLVLKSQALMDEGADLLRAKGYNVVRVPTTFPTSGEPNLNGLQFGKNLLLSRTSSKGKMFDSEVKELIEKEAEEVLSAIGFRVTWVDIPTVIERKGGLHCITSMFPLPSFFDKKPF